MLLAMGKHHNLFRSRLVKGNPLLVFWRMSLSEMKNRPVRTLLTIMSIVIGTSAVVAVSLTTGTIRRAQSAMFTTLTGNTDLEITAEGGAPFDESLLEEVRKVKGVQQAVPSLFRSTVLFVEGNKARTQLLGIDPSIDSAIRQNQVLEGRMVQEANELVLDVRFASSMKIGIGDQVELLTRSGRRKWDVVGLIKPQGGSALAQGGILLAPIASVQSHFRSREKVDKIELLLLDKKELDRVREQIDSLVPEGLKVRAPTQDNQVADQAMNATEQALRLATAFALLIAVFVIYNTFQMAVGERRRQLGILRAIGTTRQQISGFVLSEAFFLGIAGTLLGWLMGILGAFLLTSATSQVLQSDMPPPQFSWPPFLLAAFFGIGVAWVGAYFPARRASHLAPSEAMQRISDQEIEPSNTWWTWIGLLSVVFGVVMHLLCILEVISMKWSIPGSVAILIGAVFLLPLLMGPTSLFVQWVVAPILGVEARLAQKQLMRHRGRTTLTTGVLFIAISTGVGLSCTIIDSIRDVDLWCSRALVGDYFVRAAMPDLSTGRFADLPESFGTELRTIDGIISLDSLRFVNARSGENSVVIAIREFSSSEQIYFDIVEGEGSDLIEGLRRGEVVLGSVLSERTGLGRGHSIPLETLEGPKELKVAGVVNDYLAGGLTVYMHRQWAEQLFHVEGHDAFIIRAEESKRKEVEAKVGALCDDHGLLFQSNAELIEIIRNMSENMNGSLWGLLALGSAIASFGLINTLSMNILEQTREIGLLRVVAMTRQQIRRMVFAQALLMGLIGFVPGTVMGLAISYLISLSTYSATGHAIAFVFRPGFAITCFLVSMAIAMSASLIPAERAARLQLSKALRYE